MLKIGKVYMELAGADGVLSDPERKWIVGFPAATDKIISRKILFFFEISHRSNARSD
jgi:hypothetical protein